jgi:hypothetical protein
VVLVVLVYSLVDDVFLSLFSHLSFYFSGDVGGMAKKNYLGDKENEQKIIRLSTK